MTTHNIHVHGEISKIFIWVTLLFRALFQRIRQANTICLNCAPNKTGYPQIVFSYYSTKTYVVGTH